MPPPVGCSGVEAIEPLDRPEPTSLSALALELENTRKGDVASLALLVSWNRQEPPLFRMLRKIAGAKASASMRRGSLLTAGQPVSAGIGAVSRYLWPACERRADVSRRRVIDRLASLPVSDQLLLVLLEFLGPADPHQAALKTRPQSAKDAVARFCRTLVRSAPRDIVTVVLIR